MKLAPVSVEQLRSLLAYDAETGVFTWRASSKGCPVRAGAVAGTAHALGYIAISIGGRKYLAHRLAWLYVNGAWPELDIDHINGNKRDNRIANLRDTTRAINIQNQRRAGLGTTFHKRDRVWIAQIVVAGQKRHLGSFAERDAASACYIKAKRALHLGCTI